MKFDPSDICGFCALNLDDSWGSYRIQVSHAQAHKQTCSPEQVSHAQACAPNQVSHAQAHAQACAPVKIPHVQAHAWPCAPSHAIPCGAPSFVLRYLRRQ